ncbi:unnamed protein product [Symbiodinium sp. CCMP2592]|nr:unnamed protein product [Symbiodinium sp. CCMP2592]
MLQLSIMQGELEIIIDGLDLVLAPACRWLSREEVYQHRTNEMERLEFVHMRSQTQRRTLEREMFRKLFVDYLSRIRVTVKNVHVRLEIEGELHDNPEGPPLAVGLLIAACDVKPVVTETQSGEDARKSELLLAESVHLRGLQLYQEFAGTSKVHVPWDVYHSTRSSEFGIFQKLSQVEFVRVLNQTRDAHLAFPTSQQLMPSTDVSIKVDLKSQALFTDCHVENCLTLEVALCLQNLSRLRFTASIVEGIRWLVRRTLDFQMWPFLHALHGKPATGRGRWHVIRSFVALKRRIQSNAYALQDAVRMRINCKEYIRLYKKKFNGPQSSFAWRRSLPALTAEDATTLGLIELSYPADKLVNFRLMAQTEMKTETSINCYAEEGTMPARSPRSNLSWQVRELTPMEQLHLHGQHGFGTNIFRGLPPPPSNLKVRIDIVAPDGLWWVCSLSTATTPRRADSWAVAVDSRQPIRLLLVDSITDNSVFATMEVPRAKKDDRPVALLLGRTEEAFASSSPGRRADGPDAGQGGTGPAEWCSVLEFDGSLCCWGQVKTVPMCASHSPWDIFASFNCGTVIDHELRQNDTSFGRVSPIEEVLSAGFSKGSNTTKSPTIREEAAFVRLNLPLRLASGQEGPLVEFLRWCMAPAPKMRWPHAGSQQSALAYLAVLVRSGYDLAALRAHISLPPLLLKGVSGVGPETEGLTPFCLPRLEAACHVEHGGLVDGFVVGMHNLYNFANMVATMPGMKRPQAANSLPAPMGRRHVSGNAQPLSLEPLEQAPPVMLALGALLTATALVLSGGRKRNGTESSVTSAAPAMQRSELLSLTQEHGLAGLFHQVGPGDPLAGITLISTLLAVILGRRVLWDQQSSRSKDCPTDVSEVFRFFAAILQVLLTMGFPVHRCCLPLAAWVGSVELLEVLTEGSREAPKGISVDDLMLWAARGIYANPLLSQSQVLSWLTERHADPNYRDSSGKSVLDWACWAGCEGLVTQLLRRGRVRPTALTGESGLTPFVQPLLLAAASRSTKLVRLLLRAAGDPHATPTGDGSGHACGPLLLAVRCCEYELACEVLKSAACINVEMALGAAGPGKRDRAANVPSPPEDEKPAGHATRATFVLVESLRRFASGLQRRNAEEVALAGLRAHVPGPHPDECLYSTCSMPVGDVLHPLAAQLPTPMHRVPLELRPGMLPLPWLRRANGDDPWAPARLLVECLLQRGFRPDEAFLSKVTPALPPDVQTLTRRLSSEEDSLQPLPTLLADILPESRRLDRAEKNNGHPATYFASVHWQDAIAGRNGKKQDVAPLEVKEEHSFRPWPFFGHEAHEQAAMANATDYMKAGAWSPTAIRAGLQRQPEEASQLPAIRVVVLGAPRVGKSSVSRVLADYLGVIYEEDAGAWLRVVRGHWPNSGAKPVVQVYIWDTMSTLGPNLPHLVTDPDASTFVVAVVDHLDSEAAAMARKCISADAQFSAPRRALIVENTTEGTGPVGPKGNESNLQTMRCNVVEEEGQNSLKRAFGKMVADMVGQIEARAEASEAGEVGDLAPCGQGDLRSVLARDTALVCGGSRKSLGRRALAYRLQGDSTYVDPTAASIAWAAVCAARSTLPQEVNWLTGSAPSSSSTAPWQAALVSWERLETILTLGHGSRQSSATLGRALIDLGLICPVPGLDKTWRDCDKMVLNSVLVPDFAPRLKPGRSVAELLRPAHERGKAQQAYVRVLWTDVKNGVPKQSPPSLRTALRDLLANGALGYDAKSASHVKSLALHYFALLDCESDAGARADASDLEPGFILAFDFQTNETKHTPQDSQDTGTAEPDRDSSGGLLDLIAAHPGQGLTFVLVRTSSDPTQRFWDILCSGPHAYWAWHALLQAGHGHKPTFTGFTKLRGKASTAGEVPVPSCLLSASASSVNRSDLDLSDVSPDDLAAVAWLLCGPQAKEARDRLTTAIEAQSSWSSCCSALCRGGGRVPSFNFTGTLACCAEFEACLLARNWHEMPYLLNEALASGVEAWALCVTALARLARDTAAAALPLLNSSEEVGPHVTLLPEGPQLLRNEDLSSPLLTGTDVTSAVQVWLAVCRPCALWIMAGAARKYCPPVHPSVLGHVPGDICSQVVKALRVAVGTFVSDVVVSDVWDALKQKSSSGRLLLPRPGGGWLWIEPEKTNWFSVEAEL